MHPPLPLNRIKDHTTLSWQRWASAAIKYLAIIVPLGVGLVGLLIQWNEYEDRRERLARFAVGPEVVQLATQLNSSNEHQQRLAAYQLAWFGSPAVFLLFEELVTQQRPSVRYAIIMALADISRADSGPPSVMELLLESTNTFIRLVLDSEDTAVGRIERRLTALADVAAALRSDQQGSGSDNEYLDRARTIRMGIESQLNQRLSDNDKKRMFDIVDRIFQYAMD